ncbi:MAG: nucleotidyltransferase domain-containing protein [Candidatus Obscuribacterales bacterium]|nr:nucleotidyltransferase domain-containing protein [Candidatus Obscuribacterales bacterium]
MSESSGMLLSDIVLPEVIHQAVGRHPYPLLFATVSGAHLYGFPSPDSDFDLRGVHVLSVRDVVSLEPGEETIDAMTIEGGVELDLVTHDIKKFFKLMLKNNGYVLEQLYSPLVVSATNEYGELKEIGLSCITRHHYHHYRGFAGTQWRLFLKDDPPRAKPLLYVYRVLLTGIYLMRTGTIQANLLALNEEFGLAQIPDLIERKLANTEDHRLADLDIEFHQSEFNRLCLELENAFGVSKLPNIPSARPALDELLVRVRLKFSEF